MFSDGHIRIRCMDAVLRGHWRLDVDGPMIQSSCKYRGEWPASIPIALSSEQAESIFFRDPSYMVLCADLSDGRQEFCINVAEANKFFGVAS